MNIRRFVANDMREALAAIRADLGADAVMLSTRKVPQGVEVIAAIDYDDSLFKPEQVAAAVSRAAPAVDSDDADEDEDGDEEDECSKVCARCCKDEKSKARTRRGEGEAQPAAAKSGRAFFEEVSEWLCRVEDECKRAE